jgi:hypothetical protein
MQALCVINMGIYETVKTQLKELYIRCRNDKKYTVAQSLCYIEEEHYPWNTQDKTKQLLFYVAMLIEANKNGVKEISDGIEYIGEKANELLSNHTIIANAKTVLDVQEQYELEKDINYVKNIFLSS